MKKNNGININLGISSIMLIFFVLSLISFAVLSLSSALSDKKLTEKLLSKNAAYYDACNLMQHELAQLDQRYLDNYNSATSQDAYLSACSEDTKLTVVVSDTQSLEVIVEPTYPVNTEDHFFRILSWKVITSSEPQIDFSIPLYK